MDTWYPSNLNDDWPCGIDYNTVCKKKIMKPSYITIKKDIQIRNGLRVLRDFLRYTFTPAFGIVQGIGSLLALASMFAAAIMDEPLFMLLIFCVYTAAFFTAMLASLISFSRYRNHYNKVFNK
jgi:hypothetical protein